MESPSSTIDSTAAEPKTAAAVAAAASEKENDVVMRKSRKQSSASAAISHLSSRSLIPNGNAANESHGMIQQQQQTQQQPRHQQPQPRDESGGGDDGDESISASVSAPSTKYATTDEVPVTTDSVLFHPLGLCLRSDTIGTTTMTTPKMLEQQQRPISLTKYAATGNVHVTTDSVSAHPLGPCLPSDTTAGDLSYPPVPRLCSNMTGDLSRLSNRRLCPRSDTIGGTDVGDLSRPSDRRSDTIGGTDVGGLSRPSNPRPRFGMGAATPVLAVTESSNAPNSVNNDNDEDVCDQEYNREENAKKMKKDFHQSTPQEILAWKKKNASSTTTHLSKAPQTVQDSWEKIKQICDDCLSNKLDVWVDRTYLYYH